LLAGTQPAAGGLGGSVAGSFYEEVVVRQFQRLVIVLVIVLSGLALVPFVALPSEQLSWQRFAAAYQPQYHTHLPLIQKR
jgi:hypothetical protein